MTTTTYDDVVEEIVSSTNEVFSTMIPMEITSVSSFYQKEDMISFLPRLYLSSHFNHFKLFTQLKEFTKKKILQSNTINPNT